MGFAILAGLLLEEALMLGKVFKAYDIRGVYPDPLDEGKAWSIGYGSATYLIREAQAAGERTPMMQHLVVGWDMRASSPSLRDSLCEGIIDGGGSVIDVGKVDTPFVYFAVNHLDCAGGVQVTASHNPPQYNGFKVSKRKAKPKASKLPMPPEPSKEKANKEKANKVKDSLALIHKRR